MKEENPRSTQVISKLYSVYSTQFIVLSILSLLTVKTEEILSFVFHLYAG